MMSQLIKNSVTYAGDLYTVAMKYKELGDHSQVYQLLRTCKDVLNVALHELPNEFLLKVDEEFKRSKKQTQKRPYSKKKSIQ